MQTVAVSLAAKAGRLGDAVSVYRLMLQDGVQPKAPTFNACEPAPLAPLPAPHPPAQPLAPIPERHWGGFCALHPCSARPLAS